MRRRSARVLWFLGWVVWGLAACAALGPPPTSTPGLEAVYTAAAQTVAAVLTESAPLATSTPPPPATASLSAATPAGTGVSEKTTPTLILPPGEASPTLAPCNRAAFVADVTLPDGTVVAPGEKVTKTWRLRNTGSCAWTPDYALIFVQGALMEAPLEVPLDAVVFPGETVDLSVPLVVPRAPGTYRGEWKLRTPGGEAFGVEPGGASFWVEIQVVAPTATP